MSKVIKVMFGCLVVAILGGCMQFPVSAPHKKTGGETYEASKERIERSALKGAINQKEKDNNVSFGAARICFGYCF
ncbi:hypothetical protein M2103_000172 [Ereboglobus sp. PH5-5]|uniref:hypothetical protein n=1 Tax=Ereboglobus sp. PH5-5 TaxID=2940529 RepID=UPI002406F7E1|nr:hypothetical protein [Ereboglobus sp. PH5-5]MDF9831968.1 hypothetical protein [Ereboglobus sp. PH5-5]